MFAALGVFFDSSAVGKAADAVQLPLTLQRFRERDQVNRAAGLLQARHFGKDMAVRTGVEIFRHYALGDVVPAFVIQH